MRSNPFLPVITDFAVPGPWQASAMVGSETVSASRPNQRACVSCVWLPGWKCQRLHGLVEAADNREELSSAEKTERQGKSMGKSPSAATYSQHGPVAL